MKSSFARIVGYTFVDIIHHRGVYLALGAGVLFLALLRGCYGGSYTVNGRTVDQLTTAWHVSRIAFHLIAVGGLVVSTLIAMRLFRGDRDDGTVVYLLSGPVSRTGYVLGRIVGLWLVCSVLMFVLHLAVFLFVLAGTGGAMQGYLLASVICSLNVLLMALLVGLLSLLVPDFVAGLLGLGVAGVSFASDLIDRLLQLEAVREAIGGGTTALWRIVFPKFGALQLFAASLIGDYQFTAPGPLHPTLNVLLYIVGVGGILVWRFRWEEL